MSAKHELAVRTECHSRYEPLTQHGLEKLTDGSEFRVNELSKSSPWRRFRLISVRLIEGASYRVAADCQSIAMDASAKTKSLVSDLMPVHRFAALIKRCGSLAEMRRIVRSSSNPAASAASRTSRRRSGDTGFLRDTFLLRFAFAIVVACCNLRSA